MLSARRRSSHEERGLKYGRPAASLVPLRRSSHEERGLKCSVALLSLSLASGRSSHEERGLKFVVVDLC